MDRTQLLFAALLERPAVKRLRNFGAASLRERKESDVTAKMLASARHVLADLSSRDSRASREEAERELQSAQAALDAADDEDEQAIIRQTQRLTKAKTAAATLTNCGTKTAGAKLAFESILAALVPDDAKEGEMLRTIERILGVNREQLRRTTSRKRSIAEAGHTAEALVEALGKERKRRKDWRGEGRKVPLYLALPLLLMSTRWPIRARSLLPRTGVRRVLALRDASRHQPAQAQAHPDRSRQVQGALAAHPVRHERGDGDAVLSERRVLGLHQPGRAALQGGHLLRVQVQVHRAGWLRGVRVSHVHYGA